MRPYSALGRLFAVLSLCSTSVGAPAAARAEGASFRLPPVPVEIYGGSTAPTCAWPSTAIVRLQSSLCTGTLIHPQIVIYAAHCGDNVASILFGDNIIGQGPAQRVVPERCQVYPGHDPVNGTDFAYCKLGTPVTGIPIIPMLAGCELAALKPNKKVVLVGFGQDPNGNIAVKNQVTTTLNRLVSNKASLGSGGKDTCYGDSGGPAFLQLTGDDGLPGPTDGSWRVFGITSYSNESACGGGSYDSIMSVGAPWIEQDSGIDITPCHDAVDGSWVPGPDCGHFPLSPGAPNSAWPATCVGPTAGGYSATCGAPYSAPAPVVDVQSPTADTTVDPKKPVAVVFVAKDASGAPVAAVTTTFDGQPLEVSASGTTYTAAATQLSRGTHTLEVTATDALGNTTVERIVIDASDESGGCAAFPAEMGVLALLVALLVRAGRRRDLLVLLLGLLGAAACGGTERHIYGRDDITSSTVQNPNVERTDRPPDPPIPGATANVTGTVLGQAFTPRDAVYLYGNFDGQPVLVIGLSDQNDLCGSTQRNHDKAGAKFLQLLLYNLGMPEEDTPMQGTYTVVDPNANVSGGRYAASQYSVNDTACKNTLSKPQSNASSGTVTIETKITATGSYMTGSFANISMGTQADVLNGTFVAHDCDLQNADPDATFVCDP